MSTLQPPGSTNSSPTTDLIPLLAERDITLSRPQVYRLVNQRPERISLQVIAALCDIFECTPADLITTTAADARVRDRHRHIPERRRTRPQRPPPTGEHPRRIAQEP